MTSRHVWAVAVLVGIAAACGAAPDGFPEDCGRSTGDRFQVTVWRSMLAPYDFDGGAWDPESDFPGWAAERDRYLADARTRASGATYEQGAFARAEALEAAFRSTLLAPDAGPDPIVDLWRKQDAQVDWVKTGGWYQLPRDRVTVGGLYVGDITFGPETVVWLSYLDDDGPSWTPVGSYFLDRATARSLAACGKVSYLYSPEAMDRAGIRLQAVEVEVTEVN